jgi:hypothetical protein
MTFVEVGNVEFSVVYFPPDCTTSRENSVPSCWCTDLHSAAWRHLHGTYERIISPKIKWNIRANVSGSVIITQTVYYNVTLGAFAKILFSWKSNKYYILRVCVYCLRYPACNVHAPYYTYYVYCYLWPVRFYHIVYTFSHKGHDFRGKMLLNNELCVLSFSTTFVWNISHHKKNPAR